VGLLRVVHALAPRFGLTLTVAHLDHGVRGDEGREDAAFVEQLAKSLGLPCDLGRWQPARSGHFESDARRARFAWLRDVAVARKATVVAVGHTRDDQAETVLHRVIRGTGIRGLAGIPARRALTEEITVVRPMLSVSRQEIRDFLAAIHLPFRDDASNADTTRTRARIRHNLLPKLAQDYNPKVADALVRLSRLATTSALAFEQQLREMGKSSIWSRSADHDEVVVNRQLLMKYPPFIRAEFLRLAWREAGWPESTMSETRWRRLARLVRESQPGRFDVGGRIEAVTGPLAFTMRRQKAPDAGALESSSSGSMPLALPGAADWPGGRVVVSLDRGDPRDETIDLDRVSPPLCVRAPLAGDRFNPLGMGDHETSLNDFFRGCLVPRERRACTPLVCDQLGILWVVGHRIAHRVRLTERTTRELGLRWESFETANCPIRPVS
jgi:tRNA(Ile)-lysidine synthase